MPILPKKLRQEALLARRVDRAAGREGGRVEGAEARARDGQRQEEGPTVPKTCWPKATATVLDELMMLDRKDEEVGQVGG